MMEPPIEPGPTDCPAANLPDVPVIGASLDRSIETYIHTITEPQHLGSTTCPQVLRVPTVWKSLLILTDWWRSQGK